MAPFTEKQQALVEGIGQHFEDLATERKNLENAAPDMLKALKEAERLIEIRDEWTFAGRHEALECIRAAIAKAKGEG